MVQSREFLGAIMNLTIAFDRFTFRKNTIPITTSRPKTLQHDRKSRTHSWQCIAAALRRLPSTPNHCLGLLARGIPELRFVLVRHRTLVHRVARLFPEVRVRISVIEHGNFGAVVAAWPLEARVPFVLVLHSAQVVPVQAIAIDGDLLEGTAAHNTVDVRRNPEDADG